MEDKMQAWILAILGGAVTIIGAIVANLHSRISRTEDREALILAQFRAEIRADFDKLWGKIDAINGDSSAFRERMVETMLTREEFLHSLRSLRGREGHDGQGRS